MPHDNTAFSRAIQELLNRVAAEVFQGTLPEHPVTVAIAGGAAVHFYTGVRVSGDLDAEFMARLLKPEVMVVYTDERGEQRSVHLDLAYTNTLGLMHEDYEDRLLPTHWRAPGFEIKVLSPVDLAISKLGRWAEHDRGDVKALIDAGLLNKDSFGRLANDALSYYVGNTNPVRMSINDALAMFPPPKPGRHREP